VLATGIENADRALARAATETKLHTDFMGQAIDYTVK
jgi:hypothetical protein